MDLDQESTMFEKAIMGIPYNGSRDRIRDIKQLWKEEGVAVNVKAKNSSEGWMYQQRSTLCTRHFNSSPPLVGPYSE